MLSSIVRNKNAFSKYIGIGGSCFRYYSELNALDTFPRRHIGPRDGEIENMVKVVGVQSVDDLIDKTIPKSIRKMRLTERPALSETEALNSLKQIMDQNVVSQSNIGYGYYRVKTPFVILRNMLENPGWYTPYTPYQAEIAQGRLEMLLNFQTMITDITRMDIANASLLDESTAAAEAAVMCFNMSNSKKRDTFLVANDVFTQTKDVINTRITNLGFKTKFVDTGKLEFDDTVSGILIQYPSGNGAVYPIEYYKNIVKSAKEKGVPVVVAADLLSMTQLAPPGDWGAEIVVGSAQRFGVAMGFGGPHAGFLATRDEHKRKIPGRIIGMSIDRDGDPALRMAMQTREQHIRRDRATSNICTAQALLANVAAAYAIYHGPKGLREISARVHACASAFYNAMSSLEFNVQSKFFFDTVTVDCGFLNGAKDVEERCLAAGITVRRNGNAISVAFDECSTKDEILKLIKCFRQSKNPDAEIELDYPLSILNQIPECLQRQSKFMRHEVFNSYHSETEFMRYLFSLQSRDLSLQTAMIPLGSCTMKLNAAAEMIPITWDSVANMHPFAPKEHTAGYQKMISELGEILAEVTGFDSVSFQPNSGAQGEYAGLLAIQEYHKSRGDFNRDVCLIPTSAHGTNPASAVMAKMKVVTVNCDKQGNIDIPHLKKQIAKFEGRIASIMVTYPSTHGVFEEDIEEICSLVHAAGGQVYMDGANLNAQLGHCSPGGIGADVCHLNLHKTFCIPHGGGGPGMGPIGVAKHLTPFLPKHWSNNDNDIIGLDRELSIAGAAFSSASILPITWMYIKMMGSQGLTKATNTAILNANYMAKRLENHYDILYKGRNGFVAHEFIIDLRPFKKSAGIVEEDVAKRLMDFNLHGPTMSWPVTGTLMVEPTESESLQELDRVCDAFIKIREEIKDIEDGKVSADQSPLKFSPHTIKDISNDKWDRAYTREQAAFPLPYLRTNKFWPYVGRINNVYGDKNLVCSCPPLSSYSQDD